MNEKILYITETEQQKIEEFERNYVAKHPGSTGCYHNIYHLVSEDRDGNITGEAFGINIMTDHGFQNAYTKNGNSNDGETYFLYVGDGDMSNDIDPASSSMVHLISNTSATCTNGSWTHMGTKWIPEKESNLVQFRLFIGYFDYTIWSENKTVTEIGLCCHNEQNVNLLKWHAAVYNSAGEKTSFEKKVNEKLTITVYGRYMFPIVKIVNSSWDRGMPCAVVSNSMFQNWIGNYWSNIYGKYCVNFGDFRDDYEVTGKTFSWTNSVVFRSSDSGSITDHVWSSQKSLEINIFMDHYRQFLSDMIFQTHGINATPDYYDTYIIFPTQLYSSEPIPFQINNFSSYSSSSLVAFYDTYASRSQSFTYDTVGQLSCTNVNISSVRMFNAQTDDWDIDIPFSQTTPYLDMSLRFLRCSVRECNYITFQNDQKWYTVFINELPQYPIKNIYNCGRTMYTTDTYWDSSSWQIIPDTGNISRELGSKRYFIMFEDQFEYSGTGAELYLYYDRRFARKIERYDYDWPKFVLNTSQSFPNGSGNDSVSYGQRTGQLFSNNNDLQGKAICSESIGYIAQDGILFYPDTVDPDPGIKYYSTPSYSGNLDGVPYAYIIGGVGLSYEADGGVSGTNRDNNHPTFIWNTTRGTHIACMGRNTWSQGFRVYTPNVDPSIAPTYEDFGFDTEFSANLGLSHTNNGYCVASWMSGNNANITYVLEYDAVINGEPVAPNMYKVEGYHHGFAIDLTSYFVAIDSSVADHLHMVIYDMENREVHDEFDIPEGYSFTGIAGWKNWIYVRVNQAGAISTYVYHIQEQVLELTPLDVPQMIWDENSYYSHIQRAVESNGSIESCMILLASDRDGNNQTHALFKESDPTTRYDISRTQTWEVTSGVRYQKAWLGYTADNKQLLLTYKCRRSMVIDIGYVLKRGAQDTVYTWKMPHDNNTKYSNPIYYKGFIYLLTLFDYYWIEHDGYSTFASWSRQPYQLYLNTLQVTGTTLTPNAMMNPVNVQGTVMTAFMSATNRDVDVAPEPYVPPEEEEEDPTL